MPSARLFTAVSSLDWKLGARMLLKHPALTIIGGFSLAAAIAIDIREDERSGELSSRLEAFSRSEIRLAVIDVSHE